MGKSRDVCHLNLEIQKAFLRYLEYLKILRTFIHTSQPKSLMCTSAAINVINTLYVLRIVNKFTLLIVYMSINSLFYELSEETYFPSGSSKNI